jgi:hypothetical protein
MRNPSLEKDLAIPRGHGVPQKKSGPKSPKELWAAPRTGYPESENSLLRSSSLGHRLNCGVCGLASGAPVFIPRRFATIWFTSVSAASRLNRGSASCSAHRRATAMWTGHAIGLVSPIENDQFSNWRRQYKERFSSAQGGIFVIPSRAHCSHFHRHLAHEFPSLVCLIRHLFDSHFVHAAAEGGEPTELDEPDG